MIQTRRSVLSLGARFVLLGMLLAVVVSSPLFAQDVKKKKSAGEAKKRVAPEMLPIEEQPGLPRVLLIGDSISIGYTLPVRALLKDKANVIRPLTNCGPTTRGVDNIESWLGEGKWDVIHFNFGLHDMVFFAADGKTRAEPTAEGARHQVPEEDYEKNLRTLVARLKKTNAKLIWCTTTPVPEGSSGRLADEAVLYNSIAAKVMQENEIAVNDLHAFALAQLKDIQLPKNVHFTPAGSKVLAGEVARVIEAALPSAAGR
jgi:acyl-CoA thioesterase-1